MKELTHCPKCKFDLRGEDIYQFFLKRYEQYDVPYPKTLKEIFQIIKEYPNLYKNAPNKAKLKSLTFLELNAWYSAQSYGWSFEEPKSFKKEIGVEFPGYYDGVAVWQCPECKYKWKRFDSVPDKYLK